MRLLGVHPGPFDVHKGLFAARAARARARRAIAAPGRSPGPAHRSAGRGPSHVFSPAAKLAARSRRVFLQLPGERARDRRDLAKATKARFPEIFVCVGGHSASFTASAIIEHGAGAIDCVLKGEGEAAMPLLIAAIEAGTTIASVPGAVTAAGEGPPPSFVHSLDELMPARDLLRYRRKYFLGTLDPCASIEFSRGCPWDCSFCSAWTFYGRSYRLVSPQRVVEDLRSIREPGVFIVDDVAFVHERHGMEIGEAIARAGIRKRYYLETRGDVLLRNKEVFRLWQRLGLKTMFLGLEAIDEEGLRKYRKRVSLGRNFEAVEFARSLGVNVAINLIADPDWDHERFRIVREWCLEMPDVINISVNTPYPGTESWVTDGRRIGDPRLPPVRHPARGIGDAPAARRILSRAGDDAAGDLPQAPRLAPAVGRLRDRRAAAAPGANQLRQEPVQPQQRLSAGADARRPCRTRGSTRSRGRRRPRRASAGQQIALYPCPAGTQGPDYRRGHRALCRGDPNGNRALRRVASRRPVGGRRRARAPLRGSP